MIALQVEKNIENIFHPGDILIIKRKSVPEKKQLALFYSERKGIFFKKYSNSVSHISLPGELLLGAVVEERIM